MSRVPFIVPGVLAFCLTVQAQDSVSRVQFARDVAPILSRHCLECHGPDAEHREAGLRLDIEAGAVAKLESGRIAVVPGKPEASELLRRITSRGDDRMPPAEAGTKLIPREAALIAQWIREGAKWQSHWSFAPPSRPPLPAVRRAEWVQTAVDRFVLAELERSGRTPAAAADRRTLIRRVFLDVVGLPPSPQEVRSFVNDPRPDTYQRLVDRLLASPRYGQRWGRHWLDVARYSDSNGSDENHAHPHAWRYRDYVITAFNDDLPFNQFAGEQLAGDLLRRMDVAADNRDASRSGEQITATGFLAIGTKILAEKDKVKMRADVVDEQIDTFGKVFLGLTLACARCHDHKFDPIPQTDYYALAGILHSTSLGLQQVPSADRTEEQAEHDRLLAKLKDERKAIEQGLTKDEGGIIDRQAETFERGNVSRITGGYGEGIGIISDPGPQQNFAEYDVDIPEAGRYLLQLRYAAQNARPGRVLINGEVAKDKAISKATGGWYPQHQVWHGEGVHEFQTGKNVLRLESAPLMSHIDRFRLIRYDEEGGLANQLVILDEIDERIAKLQGEAPKPEYVMGASDAGAGNIRLHERGSHLAPGDEVPRGFPGIVSARPVSHAEDESASSRFSIGDKESGRVQLGQWLTDTEFGAGGQTARVIVNRLWHWHFGRGLVETPNNFGMQGRRPTHPRLLDWLAVRLIENDWSMKAIHREILLSATYRQRAASKPNTVYAGFPRRRLEAEVIRDCLLFHAGQLDESLVGSPLMVKSQDPTPADLAKNEMYYRNSPRRSVYLPVLRSHTYRFFTLFDFANPTAPVGRRNTTTVPTQALLLLNDPFVFDQAEHVADSLLRLNADSDTERVDQLYERFFSRRATNGERNAAREFLTEVRAAGDRSDNSSRQAWAALCQVLISSSEFIYVE